MRHFVPLISDHRGSFVTRKVWFGTNNELSFGDSSASIGLLAEEPAEIGSSRCEAPAERIASAV
jgi:hypothetical protein